MGSSPEILLEVKDYVGTITLNRPQRANALTSGMIQAFLAIISDCQERKDVRVLVITGAGRYFCSGMDLKAARLGTAAQGDKGPDFTGLMGALRQCKLPTICALNGPALGGGIGLVFACDLRVCARDAYFQFSEVKRGIIPAKISVFIVPQLGEFMSRELMITGRKLSAARAYELGVVTAVEGTGEGAGKSFESLVDEYTNHILSSASTSMSMVKELCSFIASKQRTHADAVVEADRYFQRMMTNKEAVHGIMAFRAKKKPDWSQFYQSQL